MHSKDHGACVRPCVCARFAGIQDVCWLDDFLDVEKRLQQSFMCFFKGVEYETQERDGLYDGSEIQHQS